MNTTTDGAVATTCAHVRVWRERPVTRRLAGIGAPVQGTTLPVAGPSVTKGQIAFPAGADLGIAPSFTTYMDVPPFRTGRPPV